MTKDEALRLALDTLKEVREETFRLMRNGERLYSEDKVWSTIISIQEVLAQPEQEPVAVKLMTERIITDNNGRKHITTEPLPHQSEQGNTMTKEVMQQALEVLKSKDTWGSSIREAKEDAIKALEEALETKDAPVAWMSEDEHMSKEAMTLALEALENVISYGSLTGDDFVFDQVDEATTSLRQAIAHPQPKLETKNEPVAWEQFHEHMAGPNYVAPRRTWVGLTEEEIDQGLLRSPYALQIASAWREGVAWAMQQLKDKNNV